LGKVWMVIRQIIYDPTTAKHSASSQIGGTIIFAYR
jgi:hypothetical protein